MCAARRDLLIDTAWEFQPQGRTRITCGSHSSVMSSSIRRVLEPAVGDLNGHDAGLDLTRGAAEPIRPRIAMPYIAIAQRELPRGRCESRDGSWLVAAAANGLMAIAMGAFCRPRPPIGSRCRRARLARHRQPLPDVHALVLFGVALLLVRIQPGRHRRILQAVAWAFSHRHRALCRQPLPARFSPISGHLPGSQPFWRRHLMAGWFGLILLGILR